MNMIGIISIFLWVFGTVGYVIWNLYQKNKKLEEMVLNQSNFVNGTITMLDEFNSLVNKIDMTMWVQSDPELLQLFETIKQIQKRVTLADGTVYISHYSSPL
jgi:hypothetical protein